MTIDIDLTPGSTKNDSEHIRFEMVMHADHRSLGKICYLLIGHAADVKQQPGVYCHLILHTLGHSDYELVKQLSRFSCL